MSKKSFILYLDYQEHFDLLSDSDRGKLISAIFEYSSSGELPEFDGMLKMAFSFVRSALDRDAEKYQCEIKKRRESGRLGGLARASNAKQPLANKASASDAKQPLANQGDSVNVNVNVSVTDSDTKENTYVEQGALHAPVAAKASTCDCPQQELVALYHEILPELPSVRIWEGARAKNMAARWRQWMNAKRQDGSQCYTDRESGIDYWRRFFEYIRKSSFLMGNDAKWKASLDWIVKAENMTKIIEGRYHREQ